jgi:hypothetical protein
MKKLDRASCEHEAQRLRRLAETATTPHVRRILTMRAAAYQAHAEGRLGQDEELLAEA